MRLEEVTWEALETFEARATEFVGKSVTRYYRGIVIAARDAGIALDLPDWAQEGGDLDKGTLGLGKRDEVLTLAVEIVKHINTAKEGPDPN